MSSTTKPNQQFNEKLVWVKLLSNNNENQELKQNSQLFYKGISMQQLSNTQNEKSQIILQTEQQSNNIITIENQFISERNPQEEIFEDMVKMPVLNEAELINNLQKRYLEDQIFTYIGPTLLIINPYKDLAQAYFKNEQIKQNIYQILQSNQSISFPHIYSVAGTCYFSLFIKKKQQSIVISGESGAGKTENTKYAMQYITYISNLIKQNKSEKCIGEKILSCNPILEAFGNSKTCRNDNSSRFGKYIKIYFNNNKEIIGAQMEKYLLEKSRVVYINQKERNYHIFYYLLGSQNEKILQNSILKDFTIKDFFYLNQSEDFIPQHTSKQAFEELLLCFDKLSFSNEIQQAIFLLLSFVLHLGNLSFTSSEQEGCSLQGENKIEILCELLNIKRENLLHSISNKTRQIGKQVINSPLTVQECVQNCHSLSKFIYEELFSWLIQQMNESLCVKKEDYNEDKCIGLLDIFGFENFEINSFEQMCINYANEHLQQLYISYIFKNEQKIFIQDGLESYLGNLNFQDNQEILNIFDQKQCIFDLLNEICTLGNGDDKKLLQNYQKKIQSKVISFPKIQSNFFIISHTPTKVQYSIQGFRAKNLDELSLQIKNVIYENENKSIQQIFKNNNNTNNRFLAFNFKQQINQLMMQLNNSDVSFVRCIKPNEQKKPNMFIQEYVLQQIQYQGVLDTIEMRKKSCYTYRKSYEHFKKEYLLLLQNSQVQSLNDKQLTDQIIERILMPQGFLKEKDILFGKKNVYLNDKAFQILENRRNKIIEMKKAKCIKIIQQNWKQYKQKIKQQRKMKASQQLFFILKKKSFVQLFTVFNKMRQFQLNKFRLLNAFNFLSKTFLKLVFTKKLKTILISNSFPFNTAVIESNNFSACTPKLSPKQIIQKPSPETPPQKNLYDTRNLYSVHFSSADENDEIYLPPLQSNNEETQNSLIIQLLDNKEESQKSSQEIEWAQDCLFQLEKIDIQIKENIDKADFYQFYQQKLNKRTNGFGSKKSIKDILQFQNKPIQTGALIKLNTKEENNQALQHFKQMLNYLQDEKNEDNDVKKSLEIQNLLKYSLNSKDEFKDEVITQILKQLNLNKNQQQILKLLQYLIVYIYCFSPSSEYILVTLNFLLNILKSQIQQQNLQLFLLYIIPSLIKKFEEENPRQTPNIQQYLPSYQILALIQKKQMHIPVFFSTGSHTLICVDSWDTIEYTKTKVLQNVGVDIERIKPEFVQIFEIENTGQEVFERMLMPQEYVWDILCQWELSRINNMNENKQPLFLFMLKVVFQFSLYPQDYISTSLVFSQAFFDVYVGKYLIQNKQDLIKMCALLLFINGQQDLSNIFPLNLNEKEKQQLQEEIDKEYKNIQNDKTLSIFEAKYLYLKIAKNDPFFLGLQIPIKYSAFNSKAELIDAIIILKPTLMYFVTSEKKEIFAKYQYNQVLKWGHSEEQYALILTYDNIKHLIQSNQCQQLSWYINKASVFMKQGLIKQPIY